MRSSAIVQHPFSSYCGRQTEPHETTVVGHRGQSGLVRRLVVLLLVLVFMLLVRHSSLPIARASVGAVEGWVFVLLATTSKGHIL